MNHRWKMIVAGLFVLACGCAGSSREVSGSSEGAPEKTKMANNPATGSDDKMICEVERTVGSMIPETVCRSVQQTERNRTRTIDYLNANQGPPRQLGVGGGR